VALVPIFHGKVSDDGERLELAENERNLRRGYLRQLAGQPIDVVVRRHRNKRSDRQNRWHWGIAVPLIAQELGYDKHEHEDVHYALVAKCFGTHVDPRLNQEIPNKRSSALSTEEFSQLMEWEVRWAAQEYGLNIPLPNEAEAA
jgi:hypothetical protein